MEHTPLLQDEQPPPTAPPGYQPPYPPPQQGQPPAYAQPQQAYPAPQQAYSAPQQAYSPPQPPSATIVVSQPVIQTQFRDVPVQLRCPNCHRDVVTQLHTEPGTLTWLLVLVIFLFGFWLGCCLIPLCIDSVKDVNHVCPSCSYQIGKYKRI